MKINKWLFFAIILGLSLLHYGCDPCKKLAKSKNLVDKDSAASCYFNKKQYESAALILEELYGQYRGRDRAEVILYKFATTKYLLQEYITAAHFFKEYIQLYPSGGLIEDATFMLASCYSAMSSTVELDQSETVKAMEFYKMFLQYYPNSSKAPIAQKRLTDLENKLAQKAFRQADLYLKIMYYKSATIAFKNFINDYPGSIYREQAYYKLFLSWMAYADNSVEEKKIERYEEAGVHYLRFVEKFPNSKYIRSAEQAFIKCQRALQTLKQNSLQPEPR